MPRKQSRSLKKAKKGSPAAREEGKEEIVVVRGKSTPRRSPRASTASYTEKMTEPASPKTNRQTRSSRTGGKGSEPKEKPAKDDEGDVEFASSEEEVPSEEGSEYEVEEEEEDDYKPSSKRNRSARAKRGQKGKASKSPTTRKSTRTTRKRKVSEDDDDEEDDDDDDDSYRGRLRNDYKTEKTHRRQNPRRASAQKKAKSSEDDDEEEEEEGNEDDEKEEKEESEEEEEKVGARGRPQRGKAKAAAKPSKSSKDSADETATGKRTSRPTMTGEKIFNSSVGTDPTATKRTRRGVTLREKLDILERLDSGQSICRISRAMGLPASTVTGIRNNKKKILASSLSDTPLTANRLSYHRSEAMVRMEQELSVWITDQLEKSVELSLPTILQKAKTMYSELTGRMDEGFSASRGWYDKFRRRWHLGKVKVVRESARNADMVAAQRFTANLKKLVEEGGYTPDQVFTIAETGLPWKKLRSGGNSKDRFEVLLAGNASCGFKLKPLIACRAEIAGGMDETRFPVKWKSSNAITETIFKEWFVSYFCPEVRRFCVRMNLANRALLVLGSGPNHPTNLNQLTKNVRVEYIPMNTTAVMRPKNGGAVKSFKANYFRKVLGHLARGQGPEVELGVMDAMTFVAESWNEAEESTLSYVWEAVWPKYRVIQDGIAEEETMMMVREDIVELAKIAWFGDVSEEDVFRVLAEDHLPEEEPSKNEEEEEEGDQEERMDLTPEQMSRAFGFIEESLEIIQENDPNRERSLRVSRTVREDLSCYYDIYKNLCQRRRGNLEERRQTARNVSGSATRGRSGAQRTQEAEDEGSSERDLSEEEEEERAPRRSSLRSKRKQMDASKSPKDTKEETDSAGDTSLDKPEDEGDKKQEKLINSPKQADERKSEEKDESKVKDKEEKGEEQEEEKRRADEGTGEEPSKKKAKGDAEAPEEKMEVEEVKPEEGKAAEGTADKKEGSKEEKESKSESPEKSKSTAEESPVNGSSRAADSSKDPHINTNGESCDSAEVRIHSASVGASLNRKTVSSVAANVTDAFSLVSYNVGGVSSGQHQSLLDELSQLQAAVVCLQELDGEYFEGTLSAALKDLGYASLFKAGKAMDKGLATCYKSSIFELVQHVDCEVGELLLKEVEKTDLSAEVKSVVTTYLQHPSPVLLVKLKCTASGKVVSVANFNLQSQEESIQVLHVAVVIQKLVSVSEGAANSHILCGTFNVDKDSSTIEMIKTGRLNNDRMEALKQNAIIPIPDQNKLSVASVLEQSFTHPSSLKSSYGTVLGHELDLNGKSSGGSVKSSIWFSSSSICATSVLNAERGAVANAWSPKDYHVSLKVDFGFVQ